jgi:predicted O-methyltransferase YrrM
VEAVDLSREAPRDVDVQPPSTRSVRAYAHRTQRGVRRWARRRGLDTIGKRRHEPGFDALTDAIRAMGADSLPHFQNGYTHEGGLALQQHPEEFAALCLFLRSRRPYRRYLEIGTGSGGQCLALFREVGFERGVVLDDGRHPRAAEQEGNLGQIPHLERFIGDSHSDQAREFLEQRLDGPLDLAFIDGDHAYEGVLADIELALRFTRPGTQLVLHDTVASPGVEAAWTELLRRSQVEALGEYVGADRPLGIGVAATLA